jgi:hypothetical protein
MMKKSFLYVTLSLCVLFFFSEFLPDVSAQVRSSNNYKIQSDSINVGGGLSDSANFSLESTAGEVATGVATSSNFDLNAGYQQMQEVYIALTGATNVIMVSPLPGLTGGESNGSTTVTVTTDSTAGYQLTIESSDNPAMQSANDSIADYVPDTANPDYTFNFGASEAVFGFSPAGADVVSRFLDNGIDTCNVGSDETSLRCWDGLSSTSAEVIASGSGPNHPLGATTTIHFKVGIGGSVGQALGVYKATTTITALPI